jgi:glucokinase
VAAIDLGGTKILAAVFGPDGEIAGRAKKSTGKDHRPDAVVERMVECVREAAAAAGVPASHLRGVGVGAPGPVDVADGVIRLAPNLGWENVPLRDALARSLSIPAAVDNDVRVAVLAEHGVGAGRGVANMIGVWPGTGVGGGLVLDGRIYTGANSLAGEIGHITIEAGGPRCGCGGRGHLEAIASRTGIVREIARRVKKGEKTILTKFAGKNLADATSGDLAKALAKGDKLVTDVLDRAAQALGIGIASVANLLNPELVVMGGGVVEALGDPFVAQIERYVHEQPLRTSTGTLRLVKSELGDDAGITGAALLARRLAAGAAR